MNVVLAHATRAPLLRASAIEPTRLWDGLRAAMSGAEAFASLRDGRQGLVSPFVLDARASDVAAIRRFARDFDRVTSLPRVRDAAVRLARTEHPPRCEPHPWLLALDFHLTADGPKLIEVNTNPGGLLIAAAHARAAGLLEIAEFIVENTIVEAFCAEWRKTRGGAPLRAVAIVDDAPRAQFLYPEFILYRDLLARHGIAAIICDAGELTLADGALRSGAGTVDLVYNRLTDFHLDEPRHAALAEAWRTNAAVVAPDPVGHTLFANKRLMALLSDHAGLLRLGVPETLAASMRAVVPRTISANAADRDDLWNARRTLFLKPARGHAGKAAYRGDKISRATWDGLSLDSYVAQDYVPAPRAPTSPGATLKADLRAFTRGGEVILLCARLYEGQTTNFRTPGGGFASVRCAA